MGEASVIKSTQWSSLGVERRGRDLACVVFKMTSQRTPEILVELLELDLGPEKELRIPVKPRPETSVLCTVSICQVSAQCGDASKSLASRCVTESPCSPLLQHQNLILYPQALV